MSNTDPETIIEDDVATPAVSVPESGDTGEGGKLKMIVGLVKKCLGVKDIASMWAFTDLAGSSNTQSWMFQAPVSARFFVGTDSESRVLALSG